MSRLLARMQTTPLVATTDRHYSDRAVLTYRATPPWVNQASSTIVRVKAGTYLMMGSGGLQSIGSETSREVLANGMAVLVISVAENESLYLGRDSTVSGLGTMVVWKI